MYYQVVMQCTDSLKNLEAWLDKAEQHAAAKKFDVGVLLNGRLAPDQKSFIYQVQSACDYVKFAAGWLSGQMPPEHPDTEQTIGDLRARIQKTVEFVESIRESQYTGRERPQGQPILGTWQGHGGARLPAPARYLAHPLGSSRPGTDGQYVG